MSDAQKRSAASRERGGASGIVVQGGTFGSYSQPPNDAIAHAPIARPAPDFYRDGGTEDRAALSWLEHVHWTEALSPFARNVAFILLMAARAPHNAAPPSQAELALTLGASARGVRRAIACLVRAGLVAKGARHHSRGTRRFIPAFPRQNRKDAE